MPAATALLPSPGSADASVDAKADNTPRFWRDAALPFVELREIRDGRRVCYAPHTHETFSVGGILGGESTYLNGAQRRHVQAGITVMMNPGEVHACNPLRDRAWSYRMAFFDTAWLGQVQCDAGIGRDGRFQPLGRIACDDAALFRHYNAMCSVLFAATSEPLRRQEAVFGYLSALFEAQPEHRAERLAAVSGGGVHRVADCIRDRYAERLTLETLCEIAGLSESHLIRAFRHCYGMTPHAYLTDYRIQRARAQLRRGAPIADVALATGFADQAHFQRAFKRHVAATPGQYRYPGSR